MNKKHYDTNVYVVYHRSANEDECKPCFFKTKNWKDKCTWSVADAFKTHDIFEAERVANELNDEAKKLGHCLAGHIKFGRISVQEIKPMPL